MKRIIKKIIILTLYYSGLNWLVGKLSVRKVFCIGYHSIWDESNREEFLHKLYKNISVNSKDFEQQLLFLKNNGHTFVHFSDLKKPEIKKLKKPTVIFFDDGFKDVLVNALPILKKHNIPATIFITTGLIDRTHFLWTLGVRHFLLKKEIDDSIVEQKIKELKKLSMTDRDKEISKIFTPDDFILNPKNFNIFLNWDEVIKLSQNGFEIGSHGVTHQKLIELSDDKLREELLNSKNILEKNIGIPIEVLSYPHGRHNKKVIELAKSTGYILGVSTIFGNNSYGYVEEKSFQLKRINPEEYNTIIDFKVILY